MSSDLRRRTRAPALLVALALAAGASAAADQRFLTTKTPYQPAQAAGSYQMSPKGYMPVYTQLVARHGTRGMTSMKDDLALLNLCKLAAAEQALTPLGQALLADIDRLIKAQALLGYGVEGIGKPGYANLSQIGIDEHRQLALRMVRRLPGLFGPGDARRVTVQHSGVDRARDSAYFFTQSLTRTVPALAPLVDWPVLTGYPDNAPVAQAPGVNRFSLYFHKLTAGTDRVSDRADPHFVTYAQSQAYRAYLASPELRAKLAEVRDDPRLAVAARTVLARLFAKDFVDRLARGELRVANTGHVEALSADGKLRVQLDGEGKTVIATPVDALMALSALYEIAPGLQRELGKDFNAYIPDAEAELLARANDAEDFYTKGPAGVENGAATYAMAGQLLADFFDAAQAADGTRRATFRFAHAETIVPFASLLGMPGSFKQVAAGQRYSYETNPWRGREVAPYAANVQWDSYRNADGRVLVRMLYNEKEADFKPACDGARFDAGSHFYDLALLRRCYYPG
jgi:hypothetical protein